MNQKKGLGKGLTALIGEQNVIDQGTSKSSAVEIDINLIEPNPNQPRKMFDEAALIELAESIKIHGIIQPLLVKKIEDYYEIIAGERRWRGAKIAGLKKVPVIIKEYSDEQSYQISLIENLQREDLNPIEEAHSYKRLYDDFGMSQEKIAQQVGKSRSTVTNSMRLLNLDKRVQTFILENKLTNGHSRALLGIHDQDKQFELAEKIIEEQLSVRETETLVKKAADDMKKNNIQAPVAVKAATTSYLKAEDFFKRTLGTKVQITEKKNKGIIAIEFYSQDDLNRLWELFRKLGD